MNSARTFEQWFRQLSEDRRQTLVMGLDILMRDDAGLTPQEQFPDHLDVSGQSFPLEYHFEPGHQYDGVTLTVPLEFLNTLDPGHLAWLVPGLRRDKIIALIKQLPKPLRRALTPAPQFADAANESLAELPDMPFDKALAGIFGRITGEIIHPELLEDPGIDVHLQMRIRVVDDAGMELATGRHLETLQEKLGESARRKFMDRQGSAHNQDGAREWAFGTLEESVTTESGITAWPALVDQDNAVGVRLFDTFDEAWLAHQEGVYRLLVLELPDKINYLEKHHGVTHNALMAWTPIGQPERLTRDLVHSSMRMVAGDVSGVRSESEFHALAQQVRQDLGKVCTGRARLLSEVLESLASVRKQIRELESRSPESCADLNAQVEDLVYAEFLEELEPERLKHYPRYFRAMIHRLEKLRTDPQQDFAKMERVVPWFGRYLSRIHEGADYSTELDAFRWLIEEFRVSVFAQQLGTNGKVSETRLAKAWEIVKQE